MPTVGREAEHLKKQARRRKQRQRQARSQGEEPDAVNQGCNGVLLKPPGGECSSRNEIVMKSESNSTEGLAAMIASCSPVAFPGIEETMTGNTPKRPLYPIFEASEDAADEEAVDDVAHHVEKKRRLSVEQVKSLEKYFELENKLEPERKLQLARELGLQPRQVAVWFQNRRARWKTKQLEKDFDVLKANLDTLKCDYHTLLEEKQKLEAEVHRLQELLKPKEKAKPEPEALSDSVNPDVKVKIEEGIDSEMPQPEICMKEDLMDSTATDLSPNCKKDCSSSDSDDSEILDDESPHPIESESGFSPHHHPCPDVLDMDALECHIADDPYGKLFLIQAYPRFPKLEDGSFQDESTAAGFLSFEEQDQEALSWWDWP